MGDVRTLAERREQYEIEKEIAARLRAAPRAERARLYGRLYDELFARVPDHPQLQAAVSPADREREIAWQVRLLGRFLDPSTRFLEIGAGDCALSWALAARVREVVAVDVSDTITARRDAPPPGNFRLVLAERLAGALEPESIDVAYSNQMIEHLHPEDAEAHARDVRAVLAPGGAYVCITPNRVTGPHDVSRGFDAEATGLHLREYTGRELAALFARAGFARTAALVGPPGRTRVVSSGAVAAVERVAAVLPRAMRQSLADVAAARTVLGVRLVAWK